jgi:hypothetical protein
MLTDPPPDFNPDDMSLVCELPSPFELVGFDASVAGSFGKDS